VRGLVTAVFWGGGQTGAAIGPLPCRRARKKGMGNMPIPGCHFSADNGQDCPPAMSRFGFGRIREGGGHRRGGKCGAVGGQRVFLPLDRAFEMRA
jgi:hypothetical protein